MRVVSCEWMPLSTLLSYRMENLTIGNIVIDNTLNQSGDKQCSDFEHFHTETIYTCHFSCWFLL